MYLSSRTVIASSEPNFEAPFCEEIDIVKTPVSILQDKVAWVNSMANAFAGREQEIVPQDLVQCGLPGDDFKICLSCDENLSDRQKSIIKNVMGNYKHRFWHHFWHATIMLAGRATSAFDIEFATYLGMLPNDKSESELRDILNKNNHLIGENFFHMHRVMIKQLQFEFAMRGEACIAPPDEKEYISSLRKEDYRLVEFGEADDSEFWRDPELSLDKVGRFLGAEGFGLHSDLHRKVQKISKEEMLKRCPGAFNSQWGRPPRLRPNKEQYDEFQNPDCDSMISMTSAQSNPDFWLKIHVPLDQIGISKWLRSRDGRYDKIRYDCSGLENCYQWSENAKFLGNYPRPGDSIPDIESLMRFEDRAYRLR